MKYSYVRGDTPESKREYYKLYKQVGRRTTDKEHIGLIYTELDAQFIVNCLNKADSNIPYTAPEEVTRNAS